MRLLQLVLLRVLSYTLVDILPYIDSLKLPEGRMQTIEQDGVTVVIDYAHTPDALEAVLRSLRLRVKEIDNSLWLWRGT